MRRDCTAFAQAGQQFVLKLTTSELDEFKAGNSFLLLPAGTYGKASHEATGLHETLRVLRADLAALGAVAAGAAHCILCQKSNSKRMCHTDSSHVT